MEHLKKTVNKQINRRTALGGLFASAFAIFQTACNKAIQSITAEPLPTSVYPDPTKIIGPLPNEVGTRSPFEKLVKKPSDISSRSPLQDFYGTITPSDLHFERHHAGVPAIDPNQYKLIIHGLVDRPTVFTLADLKRFPAISRICFIECSGNFRTGREDMTPQEICGLVSQSEWTGVLLSILLKEVGVKPEATWLLVEGSDAAVMTRSIPITKAWDDAIIAYGQNGEALRPEQGYPARLLLPGWEGNTCIKWIRRIELSNRPFMTREETSKYTETIKGGRIRYFSYEMDARSIITYPSYPERIEKGWVEIRGIAWSGRGKITRVEVSLDKGLSWQDAILQEPLLDKALTAFRQLWFWDGNETEILSRAVDETGYTQPSMAQLVEARGSSGGYHFNPVTAWQIKSDGGVLFKPENISR